MTEDHHTNRTYSSSPQAPVAEEQRWPQSTMEWFNSLPQKAELFLQQHQRPLVTVTFAQSVDGSIASRNREQLHLSGRESMILTHHLRASSDAILIGINTLLIDDPQLTVRLVDGDNPRPIVLDSNLRIPSKAKLLQRDEHRCLLAGTTKNGHRRVQELEDLGGEVLRCRPDLHGKVDLGHLLEQLGKRGIRSVMVEGGSEVITSFLASRLVDQLMITIAPRLVGGLPAVGRSLALSGGYPSLTHTCYQQCGPDIVLWAKPQWVEQ